MGYKWSVNRTHPTLQITEKRYTGASSQRLQRHTDRWTMGGGLTVTEVTAVVGACALGSLGLHLPVALLPVLGSIFLALVK